MGMYDCEKCVHEEMCDQPGRHLWGTLTGEKECSDFKDRTKYVEVVRCNDCKYKFNANGHNKKGCPLDGVGLMNDDDFCSYGERREGE